VIYRDMAVGFMRSPVNSVFQKIRVWRGLDLKVRQEVYDGLLPYFTDLCEKNDPPLDVTRAFRVPPGMEDARKQPVETRERQRDVSEGTKDFTP
jgi:hypothetical protein